MQILANQLHKLPEHLSVYLIYGGEILQTTDATQTIREKLAKQGFTEHKIFTVNATFAWEQLLDAKYHTDLFAEKQLLELRLATAKIGRQGSKALIEFITKPPQDLRLLITVDKLDNSEQKTKWFTTINHSGCIVIAKPIRATYFPKWIVDRFKLAGFTISSEAISKLTQCYTGNLMALSQLIEKLTYCHACGHLTLAQIAPHMNNAANVNVFDLIDATIDSNIEKTCQLLHRLRHNKTEPAIILWAITREIRTLIAIATNLTAGQSFTESCKQLGIWSYRAAKIHKLLNKVTITVLEDLLQTATTIDMAIKGIRPGLVWEPLSNMYLRLAGTEIRH